MLVKLEQLGAISRERAIDRLSAPGAASRDESPTSDAGVDVAGAVRDLKLGRRLVVEPCELADEGQVLRLPGRQATGGGVELGHGSPTATQPTGPHRRACGAGTSGLWVAKTSSAAAHRRLGMTR